MTAPTLPHTDGVLNPVGHVIVSFAAQDDAKLAALALTEQGFDSNDVVLFTAAQMLVQAQTDIDQAGVLAGIGQDLNLVKALRERAQQGSSFLVIHASEDEQAERITDIARRFHAQRAQRHGRFMIEELIDVGDDERQVAESPDRGLDAETRSGEEGDRSR